MYFSRSGPGGTRGPRLPRWVRPLRPVALGLLGLALLLGVAVPLGGAALVRRVVLPRLAARTGCVIQVEDIQVRLTRVRLQGVRVHPTGPAGAQALLRVPRVEIGYAPLPLLIGRVRLTLVTVDRPSLVLLRGEGEDPLQPLRERLQPGGPGQVGGGGGASSSLSVKGPEEVRVTGAQADLRDAWGHLQIEQADGVLSPGRQARLTLRGVSGEAAAVSLRADQVAVRQPLRPGSRFAPKGLPQIDIEGGALTPWKGLALTGITGTIAPADAEPGAEADPDRALVALRGGYGGVARTLWDASGWVRPDRGGKDGASGEIKVRAARFQLSSLDPILKGTPIIDSQAAQLDASLDLRYARHALAFNGSLHLAGLSIFTPRLAAEPVRNLGFDLDLRGQIDPRARRYHLEEARIRYRDAEAVLSVEAEAQPAHLRIINLPPALLQAQGPPQKDAAPGWRERWRTVSAHLTIPPISCQAALASMPPEIVPHLQGFRLGGTFYTDITVNVDFAQLLRLPPPRDEEDPDAADPAEPERPAAASPRPAAASPQPVAQAQAQVTATATATPAQPPAAPKRKRSRRTRRGHGMPPLRQPSGAAVALPGGSAEGAGAPDPAFIVKTKLPRGAAVVAAIKAGRDRNGRAASGPQSVTLSGKVGIDGCKVLASPEEMNFERLAAPFEHVVEVEPERFVRFLVGPENPDFVPYEEISPYLINSIMTTEDNGFMRHRGFIGPEFRSALEQNLQRGYYRLGASSITMQMVKNVLLSREKTLSRKLQEMFLTWYLENNLTKERILEVYFNVIEFGPYLYGIGPAVRRYFGKTPKELTPREAAWFSSILPSPKRRYVHFCKGKPDLKWEAYLSRILRRVHERGRLTDEEFNASMEERFLFNREEAPPERECLALIKRMTEPQPPPQPAAAQ